MRADVLLIERWSVQWCEYYGEPNDFSPFTQPTAQTLSVCPKEITCEISVRGFEIHDESSVDLQYRPQGVMPCAASMELAIDSRLTS